MLFCGFWNINYNIDAVWLSSANSLLIHCNNYNSNTSCLSISDETITNHKVLKVNSTILVQQLTLLLLKPHELLAEGDGTDSRVHALILLHKYYL